jgi:predicted metalloprotease with PDZ domain
MLFTAPEHDTLVDPPTLMETLDVARFTIEGKPHDLVSSCGCVLSGEAPHPFRQTASQELVRNLL